MTRAVSGTGYTRRCGAFILWLPGLQRDIMCGCGCVYMYIHMIVV